jgi:phosphoglycerate dehydrogenase-like enzyme
MITASLPPYLDIETVRQLLPNTAEVRLLEWDLRGEPSDGVNAGEIDVVVAPFHTTSVTPNPGYVSNEDLSRTLPRATSARLVQLLSIGAEGVAEHLPAGSVLSNAVGVMESQTAELACTLLLATLRGLPDFAAAAPAWSNKRTPGLLGRHVVLLGYGGIGKQIERRLAGFDVTFTRVASTARTLDDGTEVFAADRLVDIVKTADALVSSLPLVPGTVGIVDDAVLAALPDGAVVVNVGRGPVVSTAALLAEVRSGRLFAALDVTDPEPLPADHDLWALPNVIITPHVGGNTAVMSERLHQLIAAQITRVWRGDQPVNVIAEARG